MIIVQTPRAIVRHATHDDAAFILKLVNEPGWHRFIGDRNVHDLDAARAYIDERFLASYAKYGFGSFVVCEKSSNTPIGLIGFVQRDSLDAPDIGFAITDAYQSKGYAFEICTALIDYGWNDLGFDKIYGYCLPDNVPSLRLLEKLGLTYLRDQDVNHDADEKCRVYGATRP
ncbi:MAG: GNAT family N-acetyltransferase [Thalassospira sp.]|uniref:GNAT family N-acetyltransferase n=1 Tax=Thalassospira sp. TaxID=1912094 RepID=UPI0032EE7D65